MKKYKKLIIATIIALIFIGTFVFLWQKSQPKEVVYNEFTPEMNEVKKTTIITGKIYPRNEVNIKPQIGGIITQLMKEPGDYVQAGEVIAKVKVIPDMAQLSSGFTKIGEKVVQHRKREFGSSKFGINRFVNGYLDLMTLWFLNKFGKQPMHFFGLVGSLMFAIGFIAVVVVGGMKLYALSNHVSAMLVGVNPYFHIAILMMILGCMLFLAGFLAELVIRNSPSRNDYLVREEIN